MPTAVPERIATEIIERLEAITVANGYSFDVESVTRVPRDSVDWAPFNLAIVLKQGDQTRNEAHDYPGNPPAIAYELPFNIRMFVLQDDKGQAADETAINDAEATVVKAICDATNWWIFDDCSYDAFWGGTTYFRSDQGDHTGFTKELIVRYRVAETDPYVVR